MFLTSHSTIFSFRYRRNLMYI